MLKILLKTFLATVAVAVVYLFFAHWQIYRRITISHLKPSDNRHIYVFNDSATSSSGIVYAAIGDSLTSGVGVAAYEQSYPYLVAGKMAGSSIKVTHLNFSYPGARTSHVVNDLVGKAIEAKPDVVTLLIGTNDVHGNVSEATFIQNYEALIKRLKTQTSAKINVVSIPFIGPDSLLWPPYRFYYDYKIIRFNKDIKELAAKYKINYIDLTTPTEQYADHTGPYYAADDFHPSETGYEVWSQIIFNHLDK
ncbi:hypothetical protein HGA64_02750 [Candidatus Falkowbacteria bacterium]|nr:hypothetical protein [Candidatus Falkowbacteria bacterium]